MADVVISGYYGLGNSGDEALLKSIVNDLKAVNPDITITALSGNAQQTKEQYGIKTVNRYNFFSIINEFRKARLLISGGGTLIQDATSTKSLLYYLGLIFLAKKMKLKVMVYANGIGPLQDKNIQKVKKILNEVDLITLRENTSLQELKRCEVTKPRVVVTADPAFNLTPAEKSSADEVLKKYSITSEYKLIAVSVRECKGMPSNFEEEMASALDKLAQKGYIPIFIPMQREMDLKISLSVAKKMKARAEVVDCELSVAEMLAVIGRCDIACGMRLHMLIFASVVDVPMAGIAYDPKIKGFMEYMNQNNFVELEAFSGEQFFAVAEKCIEKLPEMKEHLMHSSDILREKAKENAYLAVELINK